MTLYKYFLLLSTSLLTTRKAYIPCLAKVVASILVVLLRSSFYCQAQTPSPEKKKEENTSVLKTPVSCQYSNMSIEEILGKLQTKYHVAFTYVNNEIPLEKKVSVYLVNGPLEKALDQLFRNSSITYQEIGSQILLKKSEIIESTQEPLPQKTSVADSIPRKAPTPRSNEWNWGKLFSFQWKKPERGSTEARLPIPKDSVALRLDSIAKEEEQQKRRNKRQKDLAIKDWKWRIGASSTADYTFRFLNGNAPYIANRNAIESGAFGYSLGITLDRKLEGNFYFRTGIDLLKRKEKGSYTLLKEYIPPPPKRKNMAKDSTLSYANNYLFLGIPLMIGYSYGTRWFVSVNMGLEPTLLLASWTNYSSNRSPVVYPSDYTPNPELKKEGPPKPKKDEPVIGDSSYYYREYVDIKNRQLNRLGISYLLSVEAGYRMNNRFAVSLSPIFKCFLTSIQNTEGAKEKPYSFGLAMALYYMF